MHILPLGTHRLVRGAEGLAHGFSGSYLGGSSHIAVWIG
jgi:hypothetical protein